MQPVRALLPLLVACLLAGCGEDGPADTPTSAPPPDRSSAADSSGGKFLVAALGDSITAGSPLWDPDSAVRAQIGPGLDERSQFEYWAQREVPAAEFRNCGIFGERTDQIALRLDDCAAGADALIVQGGINDVVQGRSVDDAASDIDSMVRRGQGAGIPVAVAEVLPWNNGHPTADAPIDELNREIERIARRRGAELLRFHDVLEDPARPGTMRVDLTIDGDHPSLAGYRLLGERVVAPYLRSVEPAP